MAQTNVQSHLRFLKARSTELKQKSAAWVAARQDRIGASEIAALTGNSPFETRISLFQKKIRPVFTHDKTACAWGTLFEPIARKYFERSTLFKFNDYFKNKDNSIVLLEFKCPFKRKIAMYPIPHHYRQQIQTGLAFSGPDVNKGLFLDTYFRMCKLNDLEPSLKHNEWLNDGNI